MATSQLRELTDDQLVERLRENERELVRLRFRHSSNQLENTASLAKVRKDIARIKTEVRTREVSGNLAKGALEARSAARAETSQPAAPEAPVERGGFLKGIVDRLTGKE